MKMMSLKIFLEKYFLKESRHYDHDIKYKGIDERRYLFDEDEDEDYYEPKLTNSAFKNNYSHPVSILK